MKDRFDRRWWLLRRGKDADVHLHVMAEALRVAKEDDRREKLRWWRAIYEDEGTESVAGFEELDGPIRDNVTQNGIDALHARLLQAEPAVNFETFAGDWGLQQKAKRLSLWVEGEFDRLDVSMLGSGCLLDALVEGDAVVKGCLDEDDDRPALEQVWAGDLLIPKREQRTGAVRTMYQVAHIDKEVLCERYPSLRDEIRAASDDLNEDMGDADEGDDLCLVIEAWHLGTGEVKGRRVLCTTTCTLEDEEWEHQRFPFVRLPCFRRSRRYWSQGLAQRFYGPQCDLNDMANKADEILNSCTTSLWLKPGSNAAAYQMENRPGRIYTATEPPTLVGGAELATPFTMRQAELKRAAYEERGISQLAASAVKPAGLNSGKALNVHQDVESVRHKQLGEQYQRFFVEIAKLLIWLAETLVGTDKSKATKLKALGGRGALEAVSYADGRMDRDEYRIRPKPRSKLSTTPAARLQEVIDMFTAQLIDDRDEARELLEMPDLENYNSVRSAGRDAVRHAVQAAIDGPRNGKPVVANGAMPLDYAIKFGTLQALKAQAEGAPQEVFDRVMAFVSHAKRIKDKQEADAAAQLQAQQPPPQAPPGAGLPLPAGM